MSEPSLATVDEAFLEVLGPAIWSCAMCAPLPQDNCTRCECFCRRSHKLKRYAQLYRGVVLEYAEQSTGPVSIFKTRSHILQAIGEFRPDLNITRREYYSKLCHIRALDESTIDQVELLNATNLVVKLVTTMDCAASQQSWHRLESRPHRRTTWSANTPVIRYVDETFPIGDHHVLSYPGSDLHIEMRSQLRADKLQKRLGLAFRSTHDIRNHLHFDRKDNILEIFHHIAFVKEHLRSFKSASQSPDQDQHQPLPRQLLLEVLDSIQGILFPLSHARSKRLLQSLIRTQSLDPEMANFEFSAIRNPGEEEIAYVYLADRLSDLYNEMQNPRPRGWFDKQMEMRSGARYMMLATLIGVLFAVMLGFLALSVSCLQTWIAWQAWKHPVSPSDD